MQIPLPPYIHESWKHHLHPLFQTNEFKKLLPFILKGNYTPAKNDIFKIFKMPIGTIRVVIIGQSPYPNIRHANGIAFAVPKDIDITVTQHILQTELSSCYPDAELDNTLVSWLKQGVFLLNRHLTLSKDVGVTHDWSFFTNEVVKILNEHRTGLHFALWGNVAQEVESFINTKVHFVYKAKHPMCESYGKNIKSNGFYGTKHFLKINKEIAASNGKDYVIKW